MQPRQTIFTYSFFPSSSLHRNYISPYFHSLYNNTMRDILTNRMVCFLLIVVTVGLYALLWVRNATNWGRVLGSLVGIVLTTFVPSSQRVAVVVKRFLYLIFFTIMLMSIPATIRSSVGDKQLLSKSDEYNLLHNTRRFNEHSIFGTHNSTHKCSLFSYFFLWIWCYTHGTLAEQLSSGIRNIELDIWWNIHLGRWEVHHEYLIDDLTTSTSPDLRTALAEIHSWSVLNKPHFPIAVNLDVKGGYLFGTSWVASLLGRGFNSGDGYLQYAYDSLRDDIHTHWGDNGIVNPWTLTDGNPHLIRSVLEQKGWPSASKLSSKTMFFINAYGHKSTKHVDRHYLFVRGEWLFEDKEEVYYEEWHKYVNARQFITRSTNTEDVTFVTLKDLSKLNISITLRDVPILNPPLSKDVVIKEIKQLEIDILTQTSSPGLIGMFDSLKGLFL